MIEYSKVYKVGTLRQFAGFPHTEEGDEAYYFLWEDFTVTKKPIRANDSVINLTEVSLDWKDFCVEQLKFAIPDDLLPSETNTVKA